MSKKLVLTSGKTNSPCRTGHSSRRFDSSAEDDELHAIDDGIACDVAN